MTTLTKFASSNAVVATGWTSPTNAYADDTSFATAAPGKNASITSDFGFDGITTAEIPDGSTINSVTLVARIKSSTTGSTGAVCGLSAYNNSVLIGTETTNGMTLTEVDVTKAFSTVPTLADLRTAGQIEGRVRGSRSSSNTAITWSLDYVTMTIDYTAAAPPTDKTGSDSGSGTDAVASTEAAITGSDTGSGADASGAPGAAIGGALEAGAATDTVADLAVALGGTEAGAGSDSGAAVTVPKTASDSGVGTDAQATTGGGSSTVVQDTFAGALGLLTAHTPDTGGAWSDLGSMSFMQVDGNGHVRAQFNNGVDEWAMQAGSVGDADQYFDLLWSTNSDAIGGGVHARGDGLYVNGNRYYVYQTASYTNLYRVTNGVYTSLAQVVSAVGSGDYRLRLQVAGVSPTSLRFRSWQIGGSEPGSWSIDTTDNTTGNQRATGRHGIVLNEMYDVGPLPGDNYSVTTGGAAVPNGVQAQIAGTDAAVATDAVAGRAVALADAGAATDTATATQAGTDITASDAAVGSDAATLAAGIAGADAGAGSDAPGALGAALQGALESAGATDTATAPTVARSVTEAGAATDAAALAALLTTRTDSAAGTDDNAQVVQGLVDVAGADAGVGSDTSAAPVVQIAASDGAVAADSVASLAAALATLSDAGVASDVSSIVAALATRSDSGAGAELAVVSLTLTATDSAVATDSRQALAVAHSRADAGASSEAVAGRAVVSQEVGGGYDVAALLALLSRSDSGYAAETADVQSGLLRPFPGGTITEARVSGGAISLSPVGTSAGPATPSGSAGGGTPAGGISSNDPSGSVRPYERE